MGSSLTDTQQNARDTAVRYLDGKASWESLLREGQSVATEQGWTEREAVDWALKAARIKRGEVPLGFGFRDVPDQQPQYRWPRRNPL